MISKSIRAKRRYTLMRQEIIQAARQIILEQGIDALSMRTIARLVQTSPANLYEYFLNKEEIIFSVYNDILSNLLATLHLVNNSDSGRAQLIALCIRYINFVDQDPTQLQIASYLFQIEALTQNQGTAAPFSSSGKISTTHASIQPPPVDSADHSSNGNRYLQPAVAYTTYTQDIFTLFLKAVKQCKEEGTIFSASLQDHEIAHTVWAFVHGLVTLRIQGISTIKRETMYAVIANFVDSLATI